MMRLLILCLMLAGGTAWAEAPPTSLRPVARPTSLEAAAAPALRPRARPVLAFAAEGREQMAARIEPKAPEVLELAAPAPLAGEATPSLAETDPPARPAPAILIAPAVQSATPPAPEPAPRPPMPRPDETPPARETLEARIAKARLGGEVSLRLVDLASGQMLASFGPDSPTAPASVTKILTALYALETLGAGHRFSTRLLATGPIEEGVLRGDLALLGGGDPTLDSDDLNALARSLAATGIRSVSGRFLVWGGALPYHAEIAPAQMDHLAYNPSLSGLNLNFNRVHFAWKRQGAGYDFRIEARAEAVSPKVDLVQISTIARSHPIYVMDRIDSWSVARSALGQAGSRWLPVRQPTRHAGEVMRSLAAEHGVTLPPLEMVLDAPDGRELARHDSAALAEILRDMLYYSTNLTAEVLGISASRRTDPQITTIRESAAAMEAWLRNHHESEMRFMDHSGLDERNRVTAQGLTRLLSNPEVREHLHPILKQIAIAEAPDYPGQVRAKTGTLNFVSTLAGYVDGPEEARMAFAILSGDLERRAANLDVEVPEGAAAWNARAKALQESLLKRWMLRSGPLAPE